MAMKKWYDIKEETPPDGEVILVINKKINPRNPVKGYYSQLYEEYMLWHCPNHHEWNMIPISITHWTYIPIFKDKKERKEKIDDKNK